MSSNRKTDKKVKQLLKLTDKNTLIRKCVKYIADKVGNRHLQKDILRYYGLDDYGEKLIPFNRGLDKAKTLLASLNVSVTGAQPGDILEGTSLLTRNSVMKMGILYMKKAKRVK